MKMIGIDLGGTKINVAVFTEEGEILRRNSMPSDGCLGREAVMERLVALITENLEDDIRSVGIGTPGTVDEDGCILAIGGNICGWKHFALSHALKKEFPTLDFFVANDANLAGLGERWKGAAKSYDNFVMLTLGTGVGGCVYNEKTGILTGTHSRGGELGHVIVEPGGRECQCGQRGCVENYVSGTALTLFYEELTGKRKTGHEILSILTSDPYAEKTLDLWTSYLARYVVSIVNIFDPEAILIGGGLVHARELWWHHLEDKIKEESPNLQGVTLKPATLGNDAGLYGAAKFALDGYRKKEANHESM